MCTCHLLTCARDPSSNDKLLNRNWLNVVQTFKVGVGRPPALSFFPLHSSTPFSFYFYPSSICYPPPPQIMKLHFEKPHFPLLVSEHLSFYLSDPLILLWTFLSSFNLFLFFTIICSFLMIFPHFASNPSLPPLEMLFLFSLPLLLPSLYLTQLIFFSSFHLLL